MTRPALAYLAAIALSAFLPAPPVAAQAPAGQAAAGDDRIVFPVKNDPNSLSNAPRRYAFTSATRSDR